MKKDRMDKYWICMDCARSRKWKPPMHPVTCTSGLCGYCNRHDETWLTPTVDFEIDGKPPIWD